MERMMTVYALDGARPDLPEAGAYWIAPSAEVIGRVRLKKNASVWFGAVLRGDNEWIEIGENSNVQDLSVFHTDPGAPVVLGSHVTIGHGVIVHGATVGDNTVIGMGATVLNRARIGKNSIVGAHALIPEDKVFPENVLIVGVPGRVVRTLNPEEIAKLTLNATVYVARWQAYAKGLTKITP
jgi:carbonic anhydrase/acetyltransferase-like protein (isoleucine patch superfamily)